MTTPEIMDRLEAMGDAAIKNIYLKHGATEPLFGVKVQDLKTIQKKIKKDHRLSRELYNTCNSDAMYLAGLIADEKAITKDDLQDWVQKASWYMLSEHTVASVAAESNYGAALATEWIASDKENVASDGWATWSNLVAIKSDDALDLEYLSLLLDKVTATIATAPNRVKYTMNGFVIAVGGYVEALTGKARQVAQQIGKVQVDMNGTACKVPEAYTYIDKVNLLGTRYKKKAKARC